jgi:hypothetical protein
MPPLKYPKLTDEVAEILVKASAPMTRDEIYKLSTIANTKDDISRALHQLHTHGRASKRVPASGKIQWAKPGVLDPYIHAQPEVATNTGSPRLANSSHPPAEARAVAATPHRPADTTAPVGRDVPLFDMIARMDATEFGSFVGFLSRSWAQMRADQP